MIETYLAAAKATQAKAAQEHAAVKAAKAEVALERAAVKAAKEELAAVVSTLTAEKDELRERHTEEVVAVRAELASEKAAKEELAALVSTLTAEKDELRDLLCKTRERLTKKVVDVRAELAPIKAAEEKLTALVSSLTAEKDELRERYTIAEQELARARQSMVDVSPPPYWRRTDLPQGWSLHAIDDEVLAVLREVFKVTTPDALGQGRDAHKDNQEYNGLDVHCAWRIEHTDLWHRYSVERRLVARHMASLADSGVDCPPLATKLDARAAGLPGATDPQSREVYLLHGTKPEAVLAILHNGLNDRVTNGAGLFGGGIYLAEDPEKVDQYGQPDIGYETPGFEDLHSRLFRPGGNSFPDDERLFYCFVVRAACGAHLSTRGLDQTCASCGERGRPWLASSPVCRACGAKRGPPMADCETGDAVFQTADRRELREIPGSAPSVHYHSLAVGTGKALRRFREFVVYDSHHVYAEYLLAYRRVCEATPI